MALEYPIDENGALRLNVSPSRSDPGKIKVRFTSVYGKDSPLLHNALRLVTLESGETAFSPGSAEFTFKPHGSMFSLRMNGQPLAQFSIKDDLIEAQPVRKLCVFETRLIGRSVQQDTPSALPSPAGAIITPLTDLHTHLSGQVAAHDLMQMGIKHQVLYPTAALDQLHIHYSRKGLTQIPKRIFLPLAHLQSSKDGFENAVPLSSLSSEGKQELEKALNLTPEGQRTFEAVEACYYLREPFTKELKLLPDILRAVAKDYQSQGIRYAELSSTAVLDLKWLSVIHDVMPAIEKETGVQLRFKAGLPRNLNDEAMTQRIEKYKRIAASPYVVGVDVLGYEINKTSHMQRHLETLARWMHENQPDAVLQIHAGENAKNLANVREALELADRFDIRLQIGHSLYGVDDHTLKLAQKVAAKNDLIVQFNCDSNLAINNIDYAQDVPISKMLDAGIPSVLGTDGAALYATDAKQTGAAAMLCGVTEEGMKSIRATETTYIAAQQKSFDDKQRTLPAGFLIQKDAAPKPAPPPQTSARNEKKSFSPALEKLLLTRRPIFFAGAGGSSWQDVPLKVREQFPAGLDALLDRVNPDKYYFVKGRTKGTGVNHELEAAIERYNASHTKKFHCVTLLAESEPAEISPSAHMHTFKLKAPLVYLPSAITSFLKSHNGFAIFAGGKNFTRDFILNAALDKVPFALMQEAKGASQEKANVYPENAFSGPGEMLSCASAFLQSPAGHGKASGKSSQQAYL